MTRVPSFVVPRAVTRTTTLRVQGSKSASSFADVAPSTGDGDPSPTAALHWMRVIIQPSVDWQDLRDLLIQLQGDAHVVSVEWQPEQPESPAPAPAPVALGLAPSESTHTTDLQNWLEAFGQNLAGTTGEAFSPQIPYFLPRSIQRLWLLLADVCIGDVIDEIDIRHIKKLFVAPHVDRGCDTRFWHRVLGHQLPEILQLGLDCTPRALPTSERERGQFLFVFPERMLPTTRAFFVRGLNLLLNLVEAGFSVDVVIFGPPNKDLERIQSVLGHLANNVWAFALERGTPSLNLAAQLEAEFVYRLAQRESTPTPMRFSERVAKFGAHAQVDALKSVLNGHQYSALITTGAWFVTPTLDALDLTSSSLLVDLHDVFFSLDATASKGLQRAFYDPEQEKSQELDAIRACTRAIAISRSDASTLKDEGLDNILTCPGDFRYSFVPVQRRESSTLRFGFLASNNDNNRRSLSWLLNRWWPAILKVDPGASLLVGGSICKWEQIHEMAGVRGLEFVGIVPKVTDFYKWIDVVLAPVLVQGGLNFKSVEALAAGKHLLVTELGSRCLGQEIEYGIVREASEQDDIQTWVRRIRDSPLAADAARRRSAQHLALRSFGADGYRELIRFVEC